MKDLVLILGDQLTDTISSLRSYNPKTDQILMCEVASETGYVKHHKKKIAFLFSAMRHHAARLENRGFKVVYTKFDAPKNRGSFIGEIEEALKQFEAERLIVTEPSEYRLLAEMKTWEERLGIKVEIRPDDRFLCTYDEFEAWAGKQKQPRMEYFYRKMRVKHVLLMDGDQPEGGAWNYDKQNRVPPKDGLQPPPPYLNQPDSVTEEVMNLVTKHFPDHFGDLEPFYFAVTREQALAALNLFIEQRLPNFGDYQDAMIEGEPWMYHSHLSFYINCGLLLPLECAQAAEAAYKSGHAPLNATEGFIRQIIGWREYVRGIYWLKMPEYKERNGLNATRSLPEFFWTGATEMNCMRQCILETKKNAYAHHIQRLMVLGNFALIAGLSPEEVNEWYLIVYADAYEWVELPNVSGMVLHADGGYLASKPYASSGAYINRMSTYCKNCSYSITKKNGPKACPFNYLYWDFMDRNRETLRSNHRMGMTFRTLDKITKEKLEAIQADSRRFLEKIEQGELV